MTMKRRDFLTTLAAGTAVLTSLTKAQAQNAAPAAGADPIWVPLTKDVKTTRVGFGTGMRGWQRRSDMIRMGYPKAIELLQFAYDQGIRMFDLADLYGTHDMFAEAMKGKPRDSYVIVSKMWLLPNGLPEQERPDPQVTVKRFLQETRTQYLDVLQIHCMSSGKWNEEFASAIESMAKLKKDGVIRAHGVSTHSNAAAELAAKTDWCDVVHVRITSEGMHMDGPKDDAAKRVEETVRATKMVHDAGKGVIAMKVLGQGDMAKDLAMRKKSTKFVQNLGTVNTMIVGFDEKAQITEFLANVASA
jgi:aryl-alcohol dehydrogenase-like predicted oxidoreductase